MENVSSIRRPLLLWIILVIYSLFIALSVSMQVSIHFSEKYGASFAHLTIFDYLINFYPLIVIAVGIIGLFMLKRWALYVFALLTAIRVYEFAWGIYIGNVSQLPDLAFWLSLIFPPLFLLPALIYTMYAVKTGVLR